MSPSWFPSDPLAVRAASTPPEAAPAPVAAPRAARAPRHVVIVAATYVLVGGFVSFLGWALDVERLATWFHSIAIQPNATLCAMATGLGLLGAAHGRRRLALGCGAFCAVLAGATLAQWVFGVGLGIDRLLLFDRPWGAAGTASPGRMGPPGSASFTAIGVATALLGLPSGARARRFVSPLAVGTLATGLTALVSYLYGGDTMRHTPPAAVIALQTGTFVVAASFGLLWSAPDRAPVSFLLDQGSAGLLARRTFPLVIAVPLALGWARVLGENAGHYDTAFGSALRTSVEVVLLLVLLGRVLHVVRRREAAERSSAQQVVDTLESIHDGFLRLDRGGRLLYVNARAEAMFGLSRQRVVGRLWTEVAPEAFGEALHAELTRASDARAPAEFELRHEPTERWFLIKAHPTQDGGLTAFFQDVTARRRTAEELSAADERMQLAITVGGAATWDFDLVTGRNVWSDSHFTLLGLTPTPDRVVAADAWSGPVHPEDVAKVRAEWERAERERDVFRSEHRFRRPDGDVLWARAAGRFFYDDAGEPVRFVGVFFDVTREREAAGRLAAALAQRTEEVMRAESSLATAERMASLGTLAAGLGHDMGNLLVPIRVRLESLEKMDLPGDAASDLAHIRSSAEYLRKLAGGLRLLAADPSRPIGAEATEVAHWWSEAVTVLKNVVPAGVTLKAELPDHDVRVAMSRVALTQAVFNLVQNACEALRGMPRGTVTLKVEPHATGVDVSVVDDGAGMTDEVRRRCLEPFFTTKTRGLSTGLGLALVHGLVQEAGGTVEVESKPGAGATVRLKLRRSDRPADDEKPRRRRIALVDLQDVRLRAIVTAELRTLDYDVEAGRRRLDEAELVVTDRWDGGGPLADGVGVVILADRGKGAPSAVTLGRAPGVQEVIGALRRAAAGARREAGTAR
ncbi:MAG TPA: PAS domain S-box protein [Planctomycetota bacterium]|nr:PAS domain S-box protein [Planctomycetota bacterium]